MFPPTHTVFYFDDLLFAKRRLAVGRNWCIFLIWLHFLILTECFCQHIIIHKFSVNLTAILVKWHIFLHLKCFHSGAPNMLVKFVLYAYLFLYCIFSHIQVFLSTHYCHALPVNVFSLKFAHRMFQSLFAPLMISSIFLFLLIIELFLFFRYIFRDFILRTKNPQPI